MFRDVWSAAETAAEERRVLSFWEERRVYERSLERRREENAGRRSRGGAAKEFVFYEGPPTANGLPHPGHCLTRAIKDLFPRYKTMCGYYCERKAGWDTHGLPVEVEVCKELGIHSKKEIERFGVEPFIHKCMESVFRYTKEWEQVTRRLGFWVNLEEAYVTYHQSYVESVWWSLKKLFDAGLLYQGHKIVWWWARGGTALSAGEVGQGYRTVDDPSVYVRFPLVPESAHALLASLGLGGTGVSPVQISLLVWTTTPWTLLSNMFAAVHQDFEYCIVRDTKSGERLILAEGLREPLANKFKIDSWERERVVKGSELVGLRYVPPYRECYYDKPTQSIRRTIEPGRVDLGVDSTWGEATGPVATIAQQSEMVIGGRESTQRSEYLADASKNHMHKAWRVVPADFVTLESGTGLVHEAPAFGEVDFELWKTELARFAQMIRVGEEPVLPLFNAVAPDGTFTAEAGPKYQGRWVKDCDKDIVRELKEREAYPGSGIPILLHQETYRHEYPFCWRAEEDPLIQYPRQSWFIRTTQFKDDMLENNWHINWLPKEGIKGDRDGKGGRFGDFLANNVDWSLSRERYWGTPLPIWVCEKCGQMEAVGSYAELLLKPEVRGTDVWDEAKRRSPGLSEHLKVHKPYIDAVTYGCPKCAALGSTGEGGSAPRGSGQSEYPLPDGRGSEGLGGGTEGLGGGLGRPGRGLEQQRPRMRRVPEVIDCWYDSGAMPFAQWGYPHAPGSVERFERSFPADFISEALDQTRGWFYSLVAISTLLFGRNGVVTRGRLRALGGGPDLGNGGRQAAREGGVGAWPQPFRNCIVLGLLLGEDGLKMSKQKKNYKEPGYIFDHEGADAMRWMLFSGQAPWTSIRFQESAIAEAQREFLIRLYNVYSFFVIYANIDGWRPRDCGLGSVECGLGVGGASEYWRAWDGDPQAGMSLSELDRWILSELHRTIRDVRGAMDEYDNFVAARALSGFVDLLSNWYVRRSRGRFWKSGMDGDKSAVYATLYECLVKVTLLMAPFTPFAAESLYQRLVVSQRREGAGAGVWGGGFGARAEAGGAGTRRGMEEGVHAGAKEGVEPDSVHLCDYPVADELLIDEKLSAEMEIVRKVVSLGRAARADARIKVRQPLGLVEIVLADKSHLDWLRSHEALICDELNVKRAEFRTEADEYVEYEVKPNFKTIGPKYGKLGPRIKAALAGRAGAAELRRELDATGRLHVEVEGRLVELTAEDVQIELRAKPGWSAAQDGAAVVVLKTEVTEALREEGMARELVHQVQQLRKELNLRYEQRIELGVEGDEAVVAAAWRQAEYICGETLAVGLEAGALSGVEGREVEVEGASVRLYVRAR